MLTLKIKKKSQVNSTIFHVKEKKENETKINRRKRIIIIQKQKEIRTEKLTKPKVSYVKKINKFDQF
jgi:hypothetical protein